MMSKRFGILIEPLDVLFFRDGRPFDGGPRAVSGFPMPQTLAGALRTKLWTELGIDFTGMKTALEKENSVFEAAASLLGNKNAWAGYLKIAGPWFYADGDSKISKGPLVPVPADLVREGKRDDKGMMVRLRPSQKELPGWLPRKAGMVPLWHHSRNAVDTTTGFISSDGLTAYLSGDIPKSENIVTFDALATWEARTGIKVDSDRRTAQEHEIYGVQFLRLNQHICMYAEICVPDNTPDGSEKLIEGIIPFGGEGRRVRVSVTDAPFSWPTSNTKEEPTLLLMVSPGIFKTEPIWLPDHPKFTAPVSAAVPGSIAVSGWDMAKRKPKPTRNAIMAGSAYFYNEKMELSRDGALIALSDDEELNAQGWGLALKGAWRYDR